MNENTIKQLIIYLNMTSDIKLNKVVITKWFERKYKSEYNLEILEKVMDEMKIK